MPGVASSPQGQGEGVDVLGHGHADRARIADMVHVGAGHLAHQGDLLDGRSTCPFL